MSCTPTLVVAAATQLQVSYSTFRMKSRLQLPSTKGDTGCRYSSRNLRWRRYSVEVTLSLSSKLPRAALAATRPRWQN
jgi:hypothetical protein